VIGEDGNPQSNGDVATSLVSKKRREKGEGGGVSTALGRKIKKGLKTSKGRAGIWEFDTSSEER